MLQTAGGTVASEVSELKSETVAPPAGAAAPRVTVPLTVLPPSTAVGETATEASELEETSVSVAVFVVLLDAVITALVSAETLDVLIVNATEV